MKIFTNDFLYQAASSVNCLPATRFFLEKMKVKIMNHEKCCNHGPWFLCFSLNPPPRENYWNHGQWPWSFSLLLLFLTWKCFLRGPAVLHHHHNLHHHQNHHHHICIFSGDQLSCIIELLGMPPQKLLDQSKRAKNFISSKGTNVTARHASLSNIRQLCHPSSQM